MRLEEKPLGSRRIFEGKVINLRVDTVLSPAGNECTREVIEHPGGVAVVALTEKNEVVAVRQYRRPADAVLLEIPAGKLAPGEEPLICGTRELKEETGFTADSFEYLGFHYPTPGFCDEKIHIFLATELRAGEIAPDEDEFLQVLKYPIGEFVRMIESGEIIDGKTIIGIFLTKNRLGL